MNKLIEDHPAWKQLQADRAEAAKKLAKLNGRIAKATQAYRERLQVGRQRWLADDATDDEIAAVVEPAPDLSEVNQLKQELVRHLGELSQPNGPVERAVLARWRETFCRSWRRPSGRWLLRRRRRRGSWLRSRATGSG